MRGKGLLLLLFVEARLVPCLAFESLAKKKKLGLHISRQKDICFTLIDGAFARKINSIFAARE